MTVSYALYSPVLISKSWAARANMALKQVDVVATICREGAAAGHHAQQIFDRVSSNFDVRIRSACDAAAADARGERVTAELKVAISRDEQRHLWVPGEPEGTVEIVIHDQQILIGIKGCKPIVKIAR